MITCRVYISEKVYLKDKPWEKRSQRKLTFSIGAVGSTKMARPSMQFECGTTARSAYQHLKPRGIDTIQCKLYVISILYHKPTWHVKEILIWFFNGDPPCVGFGRSQLDTEWFTHGPHWTAMSVSAQISHLLPKLKDTYQIQVLNHLSIISIYLFGEQILGCSWKTTIFKTLAFCEQVCSSEAITSWYFLPLPSCQHQGAQWNPFQNPAESWNSCRMLLLPLRKLHSKTIPS